MKRRDAIVLAPGEWDAYIAPCSDAGVFARSAWVSTAARALGSHPVFIAHDDDTHDGDAAAHAPIAAIPLVISRRGPLRVSPALPITLYNGLLTGGHASDARRDLAVRSVLAHAEHLCHFVALTLPPGSDGARIAAERGWRVIPQKTIRVRIDDIESAWRGFSQSLRRKIRRAEDAGLSCIETRDTSAIIALHNASYIRHGLRPPLPGARLSAWLDVLLEAGVARAYLAKDAEGRIRATRVVIPDGEVLYDWLAGTGEGAAPAASSHWLVWTLLEQWSARGIRTFDFMGANTPGISDFKHLFGGQEVQYDVITYHRSRTIRFLEQVKARVTMQRRTR